MSWRADFPGQAEVPGPLLDAPQAPPDAPQAPPDAPQAPSDPPTGAPGSLFRPRTNPEGGLRSLRRLLGERRAHHSPFDPVAYEEVAMSQLYGERTGTVSASPAQPPLRRDS